MSYPKQRQNRFQGTVGVDPNQNAVSIDDRSINLVKMVGVVRETLDALEGKE